MPVVVGHRQLLEFAVSWLLVSWSQVHFRDSQAWTVKRHEDNSRIRSIFPTSL